MLQARVELPERMAKGYSQQHSADDCLRERRKVLCCLVGCLCVDCDCATGHVEVFDWVKLFVVGRGVPKEVTAWRCHGLVFGRVTPSATGYGDAVVLLRERRCREPGWKSDRVLKRKAGWISDIRRMRMIVSKEECMFLEMATRASSWESVLLRVGGESRRGEVPPASR